MGEIGFIVAGVVTAVIITIAILRKKGELVINYLFRIVIGVLGICLTNMVLKLFSTDIQVGVNGFSISTLGILGVPGFFLLYGISTYFTLK